jgi:DNA-binding NtrC family response regulator
VPKGDDPRSTLTRRETGRSADGGLSVLVSSADGVSSIRLPEGEELVLGRGPEVDLVIDDPSVSRQHARLHLGEPMRIEDLGSTNGTRAQGVPLESGGSAPVAVGTVIELGSATLLLEHARPAPAAGSAPPARPSSPPRAVQGAMMKRLYSLIDIIGPTPLPVLVLGETGVGKEVFAEAIHGSSPRSAKPLLKLNCAALPDSVLEGELFGYEKGAFTGATQSRAGLFEAANGGTVFLDEVGDLPLATQAKLLRVLENGEVLRLGSREATKVDVRFISATNHDLRYLVATGAFRADLFFRLNGMSITVPPLRKRPEDIRPLATAFLRAAAERADRKVPRLRPDAIDVLQEYAWPGNVRELKTVIERAAVFCTKNELGKDELETAAPEIFQAIESVDPARLATRASTEGPASAGSSSLRAHVNASERERILEALAKAHGNQTRAAEILGVSRRTLINKIEAHGIGRPRKGGK